MTKYPQRALPTDWAILDDRLMLRLIGLLSTLGFGMARSLYGTFHCGSFASRLFAARTEIFGTGCRRHARYCRELSQHIAASPHSLDVVISAGCSGELFAQGADQNINYFRLRLVHPPVKVIKNPALRHDSSFAQA